ncbi:MAG: diaminopimelate epimerase [Candidatus Omnitrophica bacterium]|nr:diaminopimelate epimerase [Candidatus Omnitrophota bacterium]
MKKIQFTKMVATGNDFVVVDDRRSQIKVPRPKLARQFCDRKLSIGSDGLLILEKSKRADFKMRIFNPDGSEPDMCGNGSRCIALYARLNRIVGSKMRIETKAGILKASVTKSMVKINMTGPEDLCLNINLKVDGKNRRLHYINTGVPHVVYFVNNIEKVDLFNLGRAIRFHKKFAPQGTNVNIVQAEGKNAILVRTYERGVEEETLACGTGSAASAIISGMIKGYNSPVRVNTKGGKLNIYFKLKDNKVTDVFLEGEAKEVFKGKWGNQNV